MKQRVIANNLKKGHKWSIKYSQSNRRQKKKQKKGNSIQNIEKTEQMMN